MSSGCLSFFHWSLHAAVCAGVKSLASAGNFKAHVTVDGEHADGEVAAITIANAAPPTSVLAHGHTGDCIYDGGWWLVFIQLDVVVHGSRFLYLLS